MPNPFRDMNMINNIGNSMDMLKGVQNPMAMLNNMAQSNPQIKQVVNMLNNGADPQQVFYDMCSQQGVNPNDILSRMR